MLRWQCFSVTTIGLQMHHRNILLPRESQPYLAEMKRVSQKSLKHVSPQKKKKKKMGWGGGGGRVYLTHSLGSFPKSPLKNFLVWLSSLQSPREMLEISTWGKCTNKKDLLTPSQTTGHIASLPRVSSCKHWNSRTACCTAVFLSTFSPDDTLHEHVWNPYQKTHWSHLSSKPKIVLHFLLMMKKKNDCCWQDARWEGYLICNCLLIYYINWHHWR